MHLSKRHILFIALSLMSVHCSDLGTSSPVQLYSSVNGTSVSYPVGVTFSVELELNADAGYLWNCTIDDTTVVKIHGPNSYRPKEPTSGVGGMTIATIHFQTCGRGHSRITLTEIQVWRSDATPLNTVRFDVDVN